MMCGYVKKLFVDSRYPLSEREAIAISNMVARRGFYSGRGRRWRVFSAVWMLELFLVLMVCIAFNMPRGMAIVCAVIAFLATGWIFHLVTRKEHAKDVRQELRLRGHDICIECGYWLGESKRCPECGATA